MQIKQGKGARAGMLMAAGLLGASALGYGVFAAPVSVAQDNSGPFTCKADQGKVTVAKSEDGKNYSVTAAPSDIKLAADQDKRCKVKEDGPDFEFTTKKVEAKETSSGCEITGTANAKDEDAASATDSKFTLTIPKDGAAKMMVSGKFDPNSEENAKDKFEATGTVKGLKVESCSATGIPEGALTVTGIKIDLTPPK
ncbi:hypothetical protein [Nocardia sp. NPDC050175]|uniref:hypothetical protein n=1 Tax=Nocardia sp. NPDC050175 TaxID=3364317 RepID=UPI00379AA599